MSEARVKRGYHSPLRAAQVELSRDRVLEAASSLFLTRGYAATSIAAIADRAGVVRETVYKLFGTKSGLLKRLYDVTVAGDPQETAIEDREWWQQMLAADPHTLVAEAERLAGVRGMVAALVGKAALRDDLDPDEAADIAWALISPEMWQLLTQRRGWDPARYQAWLDRSLRDSLLG
jgi:AcrR family transcriptional regulator